MLQAGETLAGYRIETVAGVGGMGVVYRATQISLDRPVALKVLSSTLVGNRTFRERFRREGRHAAALDHPNIIPVYEAGESNGLMFIAMRLVDGPSLADLIDRGEITGREALRVLGSIASALDAAHDANLVHRDIKPQNILLTKLGHPYLADFGITKGSDHGGLTHSGDFVGSLNYVAPEQIEAKDVGGSSDIYSLAAVLFQALSGTYPYQRDTDAALMHAHLSAPPPSFADRGISAPAALDAVFARGMAKDPEARFPSGTALVEAAAAACAPVGAAVLDSAPAFPAPRDEWSDASDDPVAPTHPDLRGWSDPEPDPLPAPVAVVAPPARTTRSGDVTTADTRRIVVTAPAPAAREPKPARTRPRVAVPWPLITAGVLVVASPVAGYALGHTSPPTAPKTVKTDEIKLTYAPGWLPGTDGSAAQGRVTLHRADGLRLTAGRIANYQPGFDPLPAPVRTRLTGKPKPTMIRIGNRDALQYVAKSTVVADGAKTERPFWAAFVPDSKGWVAVTCEGPGAAAPTGCPAVAATLVVSGATPVSLGPVASTATAVSSALKSLSTARTAATVGLGAKSLPRRRSAARRLASAHSAAAHTIGTLAVRPQERPLFTAVAHALTAQSTNLIKLGAAAGRRDVAAYSAARKAVRAQDIVIQSALGKLKAAGYGA